MCSRPHECRLLPVARFSLDALPAAFRLLRGVCCMPQAARFLLALLPAVCCTLSVVFPTLSVIGCMLHVARCMLRCMS
jgi:hypothetical protein